MNDLPSKAAQMTGVLSIEHSEFLDVAAIAYNYRDCASESNQQETHVSMRSLYVRCEPRANNYRCVSIQCTFRNTAHNKVP